MGSEASSFGSRLETSSGGRSESPAPEMSPGTSTFYLTGLTAAGKGSWAGPSANGQSAGYEVVHLALGRGMR